MKASDLMVGDWVYNKHHKKNIQIQPYDFFVHGHCNNGTFAVSSTIVSGRDFVPIPLTEDILVKNGFELGEKIGEVGVHIYRHTVYKMDNFSLEVYSDNTFHFASIKLNYVHQLQHLLRLCGIEKEITI